MPLTRRDFLSAIPLVLSIPAIWWWLGTGRRTAESRPSGEKILIGSSIPEGISFLGGAILVSKEGSVNAFAAKCTHLGCEISMSSGSSIDCPCHGSRFGLDGKPLNGPATEALKELEVRLGREEVAQKKLADQCTDLQQNESSQNEKLQVVQQLCFQAVLQVQVRFARFDPCHVLHRVENTLRSSNVTSGAHANVDFMSAFGNQAESFVKGRDMLYAG